MKKSVYIILIFCHLTVAQQVTKKDSLKKIDKKELLKKNKDSIRQKKAKENQGRFNKIDQKNVKNAQESYEKQSLERIQLFKQSQIKGIFIDDFESFDFKKFSTLIDSREVDLTDLSGNMKKGEIRLTGPSQFDSRIELRRLDASVDWQWSILQREKSVGIIVEKKQLKLISRNIFQLDITNTLSTSRNICKKEPFTNQPIVGVGTAFIIDSDLMLTARHVLNKPLNNYAVVFGYEVINTTGVVESIIPSENIFYIDSVSQFSKILDYAVIKLDREIKNRKSLDWEKSSSLKEGDEVYMIGHPLGLPKKVALNASIASNNHQQFFYTTLDSFQGNSGSPVFDFVSHKVIGILVSGELDYKFNGNCYESTLCKIPYCKGEKVIRIESILKDQ